MYVHGVGVWTPGYPNGRSWIEDAPGRTDPLPPCSLANPRLLRGTSMLTRLFVEAAAGAGTDAGWDLSTAATVFGSAFGETQIALAQFEMMRSGDGLVSPHRFKNSVHNTGAGVFSIAAKNHGFTTALAGGWETTANVLMESYGLLASGHEHVIACIADEPLPANFSRDTKPFVGVGVAFALARTPAGPPRYGALSELRVRADSAESPEPVALEDALARNPAAPALVLARAVAAATGRAERQAVPLCHRGDVRWTVQVTP
jgi:hypothetical protein